MGAIFDDEEEDNDDTNSIKVIGQYNWTYSLTDYYQTNQFSIPTMASSGNTFVKVDFKLKNIDSASLSTSKTNFKFTADGITYDVEKVIGNSGYFADYIDRGETVSRTFYYEVPIGTHNFTFEWCGKGNVVKTTYL